MGGIPEVVVDGETGLLVPLELRTDEPMAPADAAAYEQALAEAINFLVADPARRSAMGEAGRLRAVEDFSWRADLRVRPWSCIAACLASEEAGKHQRSDDHRRAGDGIDRCHARIVREPP